MANKKLLAYHVMSKFEMNKLDDSSPYKGRPPSANPRYVELAEHIEVIQSPSPGRLYLYVVWPDKCKYLQAWDAKLLEIFLGKEHKNLFKKKQKVWSLALEKQLLKDAKLTT